MKDLVTIFATVIGFLGFALAMMAVVPILSVFFGALGGWMVQVFVGDWIAEGARDN